MTTLKEVGSERGDNGECLCKLCSAADTVVARQMVAPPPTTTTETAGLTTTNQSTTAAKPTAKARKKRLVKPATHANVGAPAALAPAPAQVLPLPTIAPHPCPFVYHPPFSFYYMSPPIVAPAACCSKYKEWLSIGVGRPQHHPLCPKLAHTYQLYIVSFNINSSSLIAP